MDTSKNYFENIYLPFNSIPQEIIDQIEEERALSSIKDLVKTYRCKCGFVYAVGECGKNVTQAKCPNCQKLIGGLNHINIDYEYQRKNIIIKEKGIEISLISQMYEAPRDLLPLAFRFGNLINFVLIFLSNKKDSVIDKRKCHEIIIQQWEIIKNLLKIQDEYIPLIAIELLNNLLQIQSQDFTIRENRIQFEQQFNQKVNLIQNNVQQIIDKKCNKIDKNKEENASQYFTFYNTLREINNKALFRNTLQIYSIPDQDELKEKYISQNKNMNIIHKYLDDIKKIQLVYPLVHFYKKIHQMYSGRLTEKFARNNTLYIILKRNPYLQNYFTNYVLKSWNEICQSIPKISIGCKQNQELRQIRSSDTIELEYFLIKKKERQNEATQGEQLNYFFSVILEIQNTILEQLEVEEKKNLFELLPQDIIQFDENILMKDLILFENFKLDIKQQMVQTNPKLIIDYYAQANLLNKCKIEIFDQSNYFVFLPDVSNLNKLYSPDIDNKFHTRLTDQQKEKFLRYCISETQKSEIRIQIFYIYSFIKMLSKEKQIEKKDNYLSHELKEYGLFIDEQYFENSISNLKISHISHILSILEEHLMDNLVQDIDKRFQDKLSESDFNQFIQNYQQNVIPQIKKKRQKLLLQQQQQIDQNPKNYQSKQFSLTNSDLMRLVGSYIIRCINSNKEAPRLYPEQDIFQYILYFEDQDFSEKFILEGEDDFYGMNLKHKYLFSLYQRLNNIHHEETKQQKQDEENRNKELEKDLKNQQINLMDFEMQMDQIQDDVLYDENQKEKNGKQIEPIQLDIKDEDEDIV